MSYWRLVLSRLTIRDISIDLQFYYSEHLGNWREFTPGHCPTAARVDRGAHPSHARNASLQVTPIQNCRHGIAPFHQRARVARPTGQSADAWGSRRYLCGTKMAAGAARQRRWDSEVPRRVGRHFRSVARVETSKYHSSHDVIWLQSSLLHVMKIVRSFYLYLKCFWLFGWDAWSLLKMLGVHEPFMNRLIDCTCYGFYRDSSNVDI